MKKPRPEAAGIALDDLPNLHEATIPVAISMEHFYNRRRVSSKIVEEIQPAERAALEEAAKEGEETPTKRDARLFGVTKRLLDCPELRAINHAQAALLAWVYSFTVPSNLKDGIHLVPISLVRKFDAELHNRKEKIRDLAGVLANALETRIEEMKPRLADQFNRDDYPSRQEIEEGFDIRWRYLDLGANDRLRTISPELFAEQQTIVKAEAQEAAKGIVGLLREQALEAVTRFRDRVVAVTAKSQRPAHVHESSLDALIEFVGLIDHRNVVGDKRLGQLMEEARQTLAGVTPGTINDDKELRARVGAKMDGLAKELESLVKTAPRAIRFRDEAPAA